MDDAPERNPLGLIAAAFVITLPFDYDSYLIHRDLSEFGILIIVIKAVFFVLYLLGSRFAWHVGLGLTAVITALALLLDPSRRQGRRTGLLFASFSRAYRRCSFGFISVAHPRTVLSLHSKSPRKSFGALSGKTGILRRAFLCAKRLAAWQLAKPSSPACRRRWTGCLGARGTGLSWFRSARDGFSMVWKSRWLQH